MKMARKLICLCILINVFNIIIWILRDSKLSLDSKFILLFLAFDIFLIIIALIVKISKEFR